MPDKIRLKKEVNLLKFKGLTEYAPMRFFLLPGQESEIFHPVCNGC